MNESYLYSENIFIDVFQGLDEDTGTIYYYMKSLDVYENGAGNDSYDIYITDFYNIKVPLGIDTATENFFSDLGMSDTLGKLIISVFILSVVTIFMFIKSMNFGGGLFLPLEFFLYSFLVLAPRLVLF